MNFDPWGEGRVSLSAAGLAFGVLELEFTTNKYLGLGI
jgi:hypothetical protein